MRSCLSVFLGPTHSSNKLERTKCCGRLHQTHHGWVFEDNRCVDPGCAEYPKYGTSLHTWKSAERTRVNLFFSPSKVTVSSSVSVAFCFREAISAHSEEQHSVMSTWSAWLRFASPRWVSFSCLRVLISSSTFMISGEAWADCHSWLIVVCFALIVVLLYAQVSQLSSIWERNSSLRTESFKPVMGASIRSFLPSHFALNSVEFAHHQLRHTLLIMWHSVLRCLNGREFGNEVHCGASGICWVPLRLGVKVNKL